MFRVLQEHVTQHHIFRTYKQSETIIIHSKLLSSLAIFLGSYYPKRKKKNHHGPVDPTLKAIIPGNLNPDLSSSFTFKYLVNSCGLTPLQALSVADKISSGSSDENADSVISLFKNPRVQ